MAAIQEIEAVAVSLPVGRVYKGSTYQVTGKRAVFAHARLDDGTTGVGCACDFYEEQLEQICALTAGSAGGAILGEDPIATERVWSLADAAVRGADRVVAAAALALIDTAVWDAVGKLVEEPLWRLWGGTTDTVDVVSIGGYYDDQGNDGEAIEAEVARLRELGAGGLKIKVAGATPEHDAERVRRARAVAGPDFILCPDANEGFSREDALTFARLVADADLRWFEEPTSLRAVDEPALEFHRSLGLPICAGQSELDAAACTRLMTEHGVDICNFDAPWAGGPTEWRRIAGAAYGLGCVMAHHQQVLVGAHLVASVPHGAFAEIYESGRDPLWWRAVVNRPPLVGGRMRLPSEPGFGWEYDWELLNHHRVGRRSSADV